MHDLLPGLKGTLGHPLPARALSHQAGLASWIPFYRSALEDTTGAFCDAQTRCVPVSPGMFMEEAYLDTIWNTISTPSWTPLATTDSDLGFYMWDKVCPPGA